MDRYLSNFFLKKGPHYKVFLNVSYNYLHKIDIIKAAFIKDVIIQGGRGGQAKIDVCRRGGREGSGKNRRL